MKRRKNDYSQLSKQLATTGSFKRTIRIRYSL